MNLSRGGAVWMLWHLVSDDALVLAGRRYGLWTGILFLDRLARSLTVAPSCSALVLSSSAASGDLAIFFFLLRFDP